MPVWQGAGSDASLPRPLFLWALLLLLVWALPGGIAAHPCEAEVSTACPDRSPSDLAACLKTPSEHDTETTLSSECTDFVALNTACADDIRQFCDEAFFSEDTILCLQTWTDPDNLSSKCKSVMRWAIPAAEEESEESSNGPTDELGMSQKDQDDKKEWQAKRRAEREGAIARMKMKEADAKKEKERVDLENFKKENPEQYAEMIRQQQEDKRQAAEIKKRERLLAAALERKKRQEAGADDDEAPAPSPKKGKRPSKGNKSSTGSIFKSLLSLLLVFALLAGGYFLVVSFGGTGSRSSKKTSGKSKKKRG